MAEKENKKILIVGNWKMNPVRFGDAKKLVGEIKKAVRIYKQTTEIVVCPSFVHLSLVSQVGIQGTISLGAQNVAWSEKDSLTGEISSAQLEDFGVDYCIVGHSERRMYGETGMYITYKIQSLLKRNITPILCIGESIRDEKGEYLRFIEKQLKDSLQNITRNTVEKIVIAYEPLWAIGANAKRGATQQEIEEIVILIRRVLSDMYELKKLPRNKILYGGSVLHKKDIRDVYSRQYVDGFLVGRASLSVKTFIPLVEEAHRLALE